MKESPSQMREHENPTIQLEMEDFCYSESPSSLCQLTLDAKHNNNKESLTKTQWISSLIVYESLTNAFFFFFLASL